MIIIPQAVELIDRQPLLRETFLEDTKKWEIVHDEEEESYIKDGSYWMKNTSDDRWMYFKQKLPVQPSDSWVLQTEVELLSKHAYGHFGLVWGFGEKPEYLNRFTFSADGERCLVMHFQKDHNRILHRYQKRFNASKIKRPLAFKIVKLDSYYYFVLGGELVYIAESSLLAANGTSIGYYIEPGLFIRSPFIKADRLITGPSANTIDQI